MSPKYKNIDELLRADLEEKLADEDLDDDLWVLLCDLILNIDDLKKYPPEVGVYFASRYLEWEVGNGGFAQAAYNIPEWFEMAAQGYAALGKSSSVELIRKAEKMLPNELSILREKGLLNDTTITKVFRHFDESAMCELDELIPEDEWWIDGERIEYVRKHRDIFRSVS